MAVPVAGGTMERDAEASPDYYLWATLEKLLEWYITLAVSLNSERQPGIDG